MGDSTSATSGEAAAKIDFKFEEQLMAYSSLYLMALLSIIWGSIRSLRFVQSQIAKKEPLECSITTREAKKFPITASLVLFTLYLVFKTNSDGTAFLVEKARPYLPPPMMERVEWAVEKYIGKGGGGGANASAAETNATHPGYIAKIAELHPVLKTAASHPWVETPVSYLPEVSKKNLIFLLLLILCWEGCTALAVILKPVFSFVLSHLPVGDRWPRRNVPYSLALKQGKKPMKDGQLEKANKREFEYLLYGEWDTHLSIAFLFCSSVGISHLYRRHWITNDLLGVAFSIYGIENLHLASFKAGVILLSGLFIYDVFWVFATEVMTTVAKGIDAPILLMFPQDLLRNGWLNANKHGMLGLGDIVIPGIFVALLHRFDNYVGSKQPGGGKGAKGRYYCWAVVFAYAAGLLITMGVMHYFKAAQPALLYLVPTCVLIPLALAVVRGEARTLWNYTEEQFVEKKQEHDDESDSKQSAPSSPSKHNPKQHKQESGKEGKKNK